MTNPEPELQSEAATVPSDRPKQSRTMTFMLVGLAIGFVLLIALNMK